MPPFRSLLIAMAAPALLAAQDAGPVFEGLPNLKFEYYAVAGRSASEIRKALDAARFADPHDGKPIEALTRWRIEWRYRRDGKGNCDLSSLQMNFSAVIRLPRLAAETVVPAKVLERWRAYRTALEKHEDGHARYAYDHRGDVEAALRGATCDTLAEAGKRAIDEIGKHDLDYDRQTRHGAAQGVHFP